MPNESLVDKRLIVSPLERAAVHAKPIGHSISEGVRLKHGAFAYAMPSTEMGFG